MFLDIPTNQTPIALTVAQPLTALRDAGFRAFTITPTNGTIYWGGPGVTIANGQPIVSGSTLSLACKHPENYYIIAAAGTVDVRLTLYKGVG